MKQSLQRSRGQKERHIELDAHNRRRHVDRLDTGQHIRHQITVFIGCRIAPVGHLVVCRTVDVVENRPGQALFCAAPKLLGIVTIIEFH